MGKFDTNPFDRTALTDIKLLAGRSIEMRQIRFILKNASKEQNRFRHILITGNRGVGKTSFLNLIANECQQSNIIPIRINLTEANSCNSNEFFWHLFYQTTTTMFNNGLLYGVGGAIDVSIQNILHSEGLKDQANWVFRTPILRKNYLTNNNATFEFDLLVNDLKLIRREVADSKKGCYDDKTKLLFLVDETQHIYSNSKIIEDIRFIVQHPDLGIGFVFAGDSSYETAIWENIFGGSHRDFELVNLSYFKDIDSIRDYFRKSLESIGWTTKEIEESLFYKFNDACRAIFELTSGKPSWINTIAMKMFERCMKGDSKVMRFDKQAQNDVKSLLEKSGILDISKLNFIESINSLHQKWVSEIFACELTTLNQVYFYSKFKLVGENHLSISEFRDLCISLCQEGIIILFAEENDCKVGFLSNKKDILDTPYIAFGPESDTIKQWLQISSAGKYSFSMMNPDIRFIQNINKELVSESCNFFTRGDTFTKPEPPFRLSQIIRSIQTHEKDVNDIYFDDLVMIYKCCQKLAVSRDRQILHGEMNDLTSENGRAWDILNFDDHDRAIGFYEMPKKIERIKSIVESFKSDKHNYQLEISIDIIEKPNIIDIQNIIIKSGDQKRIGIILEDKSKEMAQSYLDESDFETSYRNAKFLYDLFEKGIDLEISQLNNTAYVFIFKDDVNKAIQLLQEGLRRISSEDQSTDNDNCKCLILYNLGIAYFKMNDYEKSITSFEKMISFYQENEDVDDSAIVLNFLRIDENRIIIDEIKNTSELHAKIKCSNLAETNLSILKSVSQ